MGVRAFIVAAALMVSGCALRVGVAPGTSMVRSAYPPVNGPVRTICLPCLEFDSFWIGFGFIGGWPVLGGIEE